MKKLIFSILILIVSFFIISCVNNQTKPVDEPVINNDEPNKEEPNDDPNKEEVKITAIEFCNECFNRSFDVLEFDISTFSITASYSNNETEEVKVSYDMLTKVNDIVKANYSKDDFNEAKEYKIEITYKGFKVNHSFTLYKTYTITFYDIEVPIFEYKVKSGESLTEIPAVPEVDGMVSYWSVSDFTNIVSDMDVYAIHEMDINSILKEAEKSLIEKYTTLFSKEINSDVSLIEKCEKCDITWQSDNEYVLSNEGKFTRDYIQSIVTLKATISYLDYTNTIEHIFKVDCAGYVDVKKPVSAGYIYRNYPSANSKMFDNLDIIYCAFVEFDVNGNFTSTSTLDKITKYILPECKKRGIYVLMSIVGSGSSSSGTFTTVSTDPAKRQNLAKNIVKIINQYNLDGIDFDWETPSSANKGYFTLLCKETYELVKKNNPHHLVTAAIGGGKWQPPKYDLENSSKYLDFINVMLYGMVSNSGYYQNALYPHTSYDNSEVGCGKTLSSCSVSESVKIYEDYKVDRKKLIIGLAFYGIRQTKTDGSFANGKSVLYDNLYNNYIKSSNWVYYYDEVAQVPYLVSKDGTGFISYDDERSITAKGKYVLDEGLAGLMNWEIGCDTNYVLLEAQNKSLKAN